MKKVKKRHIAWILGVIAMASFPGLAEQHPEYKSATTIPYVDKPCVYAQRKNSGLELSAQDQKDLKMARAFMVYMNGQGIDPHIISAIYRASIRTNVDFELLILKAVLESGLGRDTVAKRSSARGVFQFIEPTWLILFKRHADKVGLERYAELIGIHAQTGLPFMKNGDEHMRQKILSLRDHHEIAAMIKAQQVLEETRVISGLKNSKNVTPTDHYLAHMLGLKLASTFYSLKKSGDSTPLTELENAQMLEAAKLNKPFFYKGKMPLTAAQSYKKFEQIVAKQIRWIQNVSKQNAAPICLAQLSK